MGCYWAFLGATFPVFQVQEDIAIVLKNIKGGHQHSVKSREKQRQKRDKMFDYDMSMERLDECATFGFLGVQMRQKSPTNSTPNAQRKPKKADRLHQLKVKGQPNCQKQR